MCFILFCFFDVYSDTYLANNSIQASPELYNTVLPELRKTILRISRKEIDPIGNIFDEFQKDIEKRIEETSYRTFLASDAFIQYVRCNEQNTKNPIINVPYTSTITSTNTGTNQTTTTQANATTSNAGANSSDGSTTATNKISSMTVDLSPLHSSSNLQTLHEDSELKLSDVPVLSRTTTDRPMPKLTKDLLLATQKNRMEVRPQGLVEFFSPAILES